MPGIDPWRWVCDGILQDLVDGGYFHITEDEDLCGPFSTKEIAEKEYRIYLAGLDGGVECEELQRYIEENP